MTAAQAYDSVTNGGASYFAEVVAILDRHGPWCLIGGLAVNHYVEPVYTIDADVVIVSEQLDAIQEELIREGFRVEVFPHTVNATKRSSQLSLQFTTAARYQAFIERAGRGEVLGCEVPVATSDDLVRGKVWAWSDPGRRLSKRKKDELDLIRLGEAYPHLRALMPPSIVTQFEND
ncbi:MAG: hypothetical protein ACR2ID_11240 [Chthoniobacterales bacterium]